MSSIRVFERNNENIILNKINKQSNRDNYLGQMMRICDDVKEQDRILQKYIKEVGEISIAPKKSLEEKKSQTSQLFYQNKENVDKKRKGKRNSSKNNSGNSVPD